MAQETEDKNLTLLRALLEDNFRDGQPKVTSTVIVSRLPNGNYEICTQNLGSIQTINYIAEPTIVRGNPGLSIHPRSNSEQYAAEGREYISRGDNLLITSALNSGLEALLTNHYTRRILCNAGIDIHCVEMAFEPGRLQSESEKRGAAFQEKLTARLNPQHSVAAQEIPALSRAVQRSLDLHLQDAYGVQSGEGDTPAREDYRRWISGKHLAGNRESRERYITMISDTGPTEKSQFGVVRKFVDESWDPQTGASTQKIGPAKPEVPDPKAAQGPAMALPKTLKDLPLPQKQALATAVFSGFQDDRDTLNALFRAGLGQEKYAPKFAYRGLAENFAEMLHDNAPMLSDPNCPPVFARARQLIEDRLSRSQRKDIFALPREAQLKLAVDAITNLSPEHPLHKILKAEEAAAWVTTNMSPEDATREVTLNGSITPEYVRSAIVKEMVRTHGDSLRGSEAWLNSPEPRPGLQLPLRVPDARSAGQSQFRSRAPEGL